MRHTARRRHRVVALAVTASCVALVAPSGAAAAAKDWDGDGFVAPEDCRPLDPAVHPGAPDKPDLAFEDTNCDGIDGDLARAIFVDGGGGQDARTGTREFPKKTIANALVAAKAAGKDVYVAAGTYTESLALEPNVGIYGGYLPNFAGRSTTEPTTISGGPQAALADNDAGVVLQMLTFQGANAGAGGSSYGLRIVNNAKVALQRVTAIGGTAGAGAVGASGATGGVGGNGTVGNGGSCSTSRASAPNGGSGGGLSGGAGGAGGASAGGGLIGTSGSGASGGLRGNGGGGASGAGNQTGGTGSPGLPGGAGSSGDPGKTVAFTADVAGAGWGGAAGGGGSTGASGSGGGGGGGGGAAFNGIYNAAGGSGGSGGAGGAGGNPGAGGAAGGGSFGVYVHNASLVARDSALRGGTGGAGGNGGAGGAGGTGGTGRSGGSGASNCGTPGVYSSGGSGGTGGNGGAGGSGGAGSGGSGGPSTGLFRSGAGSSASLGTTTLQAGTPGAGGRIGSAPLGAQSANGTSLATLTAPSAGAALSDFDGDGIVDNADSCPTVAAPGQPTGCPARLAALADTDGDGVPDVKDACPTTPVTGPDADEDGCTDVSTTPNVPMPTPTPTPTATLAPIAVQVPVPVPATNPSGIDSDGDGFFAGQDCNDADPAIRPGAVEIKGNRIDENCDGIAEPFPTVGSGISTKWSVKGVGFTLTGLQITQAFPAGWKVQVRCTGKPKCAFKTKYLKPGKVVRGASSLIAALPKRQRTFRAGQTLEVWISAPSFNTKVARLTLRKGKIPTTVALCAAVGQTVPQKSCG